MIQFDQIGYLPSPRSDSPRPQGDGSAFSALFAQTRSEVNHFIEEGSSLAMPLSPEGFALRNATHSLPSGAMDADKHAFIEQMQPYAREASAKLGVASDILLAHAALESGWGKAPVTKANGQNAFNLFGIKAAAGWRGEHATVLTTEFENGASVKKMDHFRAYADYRSAFQDYTAFFSESKRFRPALGTGNSAEAFASALAKGGYATDPAYAEKLLKVVDAVRSLRP